MDLSHHWDDVYLSHCHSLTSNPRLAFLTSSSCTRDSLEIQRGESREDKLDQVYIVVILNIRGASKSLSSDLYKYRGSSDAGGKNIQEIGSPYIIGFPIRWYSQCVKIKEKGFIIKKIKIDRPTASIGSGEGDLISRLFSNISSYREWASVEFPVWMR